MPSGVYIRTDKTRQILSLAKKGKPRLKLAEETKRKIANSLLGRKHSKERCENISKSRKGKLNYNRRGKYCGRDNHFWRGGIANQLEALRKSAQYKEWRLAVYKRDGFKCTKCKSSKKIHAHHIKMFSKFPELRFDIDNGVTLCHTCHYKEHKRLRGS
jgi:hypothetical protein